MTTEHEREVLELRDFDRHGTTRARFRGRSIEVEHGIPGERVRVEIFGGKRQRGRILEVLGAAADRVEPPCVYFRDWACGGCQWQHISYEGQVEHKREGVNAVMEAAGHDLRVSEAHTLDDPWRYRSTAGISLGKSAGFRRHGSLAIVPIRDCPISHPLIGQLMASLNDLLAAQSMPDFRGRVRLDVRLVGTDPDAPGLHVLVRPDLEARPDRVNLETLTAALTGMEAVSGVSIVQMNGAVTPLSGEISAPTLVDGKPVWLAAASFFQTNLRLLSVLIARLREEASPLEGKRVADVYGGVGVFGLFLADEARDVLIIESDATAVEAGRRTASEWGLSNVQFMAARAGEALQSSQGYDVVIVDPPRAGLDEAVLDAITTARPPLLLYVSCLAESLARDMTPLEAAGYEVTSLELFDFYPQTYHVELLAVLRQVLP